MLSHIHHHPNVYDLDTMSTHHRQRGRRRYVHADTVTDLEYVAQDSFT